MADSEGVPYGKLRQRNDEYYADVWQELSDLYEGGYKLLSNAKKYMPQVLGENPQRYRERVKSATYIGYLGQIVDYFVSNLFTHDVVLNQAADAADPNTPGEEPKDGFYQEFALDSDRKGNSFTEMLRTAMPWALLKRRHIIGVDFPAPDPDAPAPVNLADEEAAGATDAYLVDIPCESLIDWEKDDRNYIVFAVLHREFSQRTDINEARDSVTEEFKVWRKDPESGEVGWTVYRIERKKTDTIKDKTVVPVFDSGVTSFPEVPLIELCLPHGLWIGNKLGCLAREHFQRRNELTSAEKKSLFAIPVAALGSEIGAVNGELPSEVQQNSSRLQGPRDNMITAFMAQGYVVTGEKDKIYFAAPDGGCYVIVRDDLEKLVDEMFRINHQMASSVTSTKTALGRSGSSKQEDRAATEIVLAAYGGLVRDWAKRIYSMVSAGRSEDIVWVPRGLDKYEIADRETMLEEATSESMLPDMGPTFKKSYRSRIANALMPNLPAATQDTIREEIETAVDDEVKRAKDLANAPPQPVKVGAEGNQDVPPAIKPMVPAKPGYRATQA